MPMTMNREQMVDRLCQLAAERSGINAAEVAPDTHFINDLNWDSLDVVEFIMTVEDEFEVSVPDELADRVKTVSQAADALVSLRG